MRPLVRSLGVVAVLLTALAYGTAADEGLSRVELAKRGKATTVLVESKAGQRHGSAFCAHPAGLFLTNEHVVRAEITSGNLVTLVLNPGEKDQKTLQAKVVRHDKDLDLALLRVEGAKDLPALPLGKDSGLSELMEVVAFGYPFGTALAPDKKDYPAISINVGSITSLRRKDGELHRIQLDAALNPGNSGGPVLDKQGKVVGMVIGGVQGSGVNFAIPVSHLARFVARPDLQFTAPTLTAKTMHQEAAFQVKAVPVLPSDKPLAIELILKAGDGPERKHKMDGSGETYKASVIPVPAPEGTAVLQMAAVFDNGSLNTAVKDQAIKVGDKEVKLSEVRSIEFRPKGKVLLHDGKALEGAVTGLDAVAIRLGEQQVSLKLTGAVGARFEPPVTADAVSVTVVVTQDGKEVARLSEPIYIQGVARAGPVASVPGDIKAPVLDSDKVTRQLPAVVSDVAVGGGGRYLILHLPKLRKLAVFDVNEAKITNYIALAGDNVKFAAGMDSVIVVLPDQNLLQRWSLTTFEKEVTAQLPFQGRVHTVSMGSASKGPLVLGGPELRGTSGLPLRFIDVQTLKEISVDAGQGGSGVGAHPQYPASVRVSPDGRLIGMWNVGLSPSGLQVVSLEGNRAKVYHQHDSAGHIIPGPDGKTIFTARGLYTTELKSIGQSGREQTQSFTLPASHGNYYLTLRFDQNQKPSAAVHLIGDSRPLITLTNVELPEGLNQWGQGDGLSADKRIHFLPEAKLIVTLPASNDKLVLHRFDVEQALEKSGIDYLYVASQPPPTARKGETYSYQLAVKSKKGGLKYKLESGPKGMAVSDAGRVTWRVPADFGEKEASVILSIRDATGQEVYHTFTLGLKER